MPHWLGQAIFFTVYALCVLGFIYWAKNLLWPFVAKSFLVIVFLVSGILLIVARSLEFFFNLFKQDKLEEQWNTTKRIKALQQSINKLDEQIKRDTNYFFHKENLKQKG